jgi:hypothetical protein
VIAISLMELKPYYKCTLNIATSQTAAIGTLASRHEGTNQHGKAAEQFD